ncbi:hypothetical protein YC2023_108189 [Brassica napus]
MGVKSTWLWRERERERKEVIDSRVWSILKTDTPPRRPIPSNRRFSTIVTRKLCPIQSVQASNILCCPELVQIHGFRSVEVLLDIPPGRPKNCPEARGGSVRVQISPSRPVSVFMIKPRVCPSRGQFSPVQSRRPLGFGQVLSDQPAASRLEHCELCFLGLVPSGFKETPYSLDREDSDERCHVLWLSITRRCNVAVTRRTVGCRAVTRRTVGRGRLKVPSSGLCGREIGYYR